VSIWYKRSANAMIVAVLLFGGIAGAQQPNNDTFTITISLQQSTIHIGGKTAIVTTFANPTEHSITMGEGNNGGIAVEVLNGTGDDIWPRMMDSAHPNRLHIDRPVFAIVRSSSLKKGEKLSFTWPFTADPQFMPPGKYKLRVHNRDLDHNIEVYSNEVILTVAR
jgi:hypothetical protein